MGRGRRLFAAASLFAAAVGFGFIGLQHGPQWIDWRSVAFGAGLAAAAGALTRKNLVAQMMARGMAWIVFAPAAVVMAVELMKGRLMEPMVTGLGVASGLALFLARPMLNTDEARAQFSPTKFRRSFLAACTAAVTVGIVTGMVAWEMLWDHLVLGGIGLAALGTSMIASALGVIRMRGWGIALATLNAIVSLVAGAVVGDAQGFAIAATALPGALFLLPIVLAKLGVGDNDTNATARIRVADDASFPERVRVEVSNEELEDEPAEQREPRAMARVA